MTSVYVPPEMDNEVEMAGTTYLNGNLSHAFELIEAQPHPGLFAILVFSWVLEITPAFKSQAAAVFLGRYQRWCSERPASD